MPMTTTLASRLRGDTSRGARRSIRQRRSHYYRDDVCCFRSKKSLFFFFFFSREEKRVRAFLRGNKSRERERERCGMYNKNLCSLLSRIRSSFDNNNKEKEREKRRRRKRVFHQKKTTINKLSRETFTQKKHQNPPARKHAFLGDTLQSPPSLPRPKDSCPL